MKSKQINKQNTKIVRINADWHKMLAMKRAETGRPIGRLIEDALIEIYS